MTSVFRDDIFKKSELTRKDSDDKIQVFLKSDSGERFAPELLNSTSTGFLSGYMVVPQTKPEWFIDGVILTGSVNGSLPLILTVEPQIASPIEGLIQILGDPIRFSYIVNLEYIDNG